jgi:phage terminase small subunit
MGVPKRLTEKQIKFAQLVVANEGRMNGTECAKEAGYGKVVKYIGELREENQKKYAVTFERHITELAKIRENALKKGAFSAATNAEVARGKAAGLYVEQKIIRTGKIDDLSAEELETRMKDIIDQYSPILEGVEVKDMTNKVKEEVKQSRLPKMKKVN